MQGNVANEKIFRDAKIKSHNGLQMFILVYNGKQWKNSAEFAVSGLA